MKEKKKNELLRCSVVNGLMMVVVLMVVERWVEGKITIDRKKKKLEDQC